MIRRRGAGAVAGKRPVAASRVSTSDLLFSRARRKVDAAKIILTTEDAMPAVSDEKRQQYGNVLGGLTYSPVGQSGPGVGGGGGKEDPVDPPPPPKPAPNPDTEGGTEPVIPKD